MSRKPKAPSVAEQHADWLALLAPSGPFLSLPVLTAALPTGLDTLPAELRERARQAWSEFDADPVTLGSAWQDFVLTELLRYSPAVLRDAALAEVTFDGPVRPNQAAIGPDPTGRVTRLHVYRRPPGTAGLDELAENAARVCRDSAVPVALVTDGRYWLLVHAVRGGPTSIARFDADLWQEEPILLRAFVTLLGQTRVLTPPKRHDGTPSESLAALFARTIDAQAEITTTLGTQVRQAVELFVGELARLDRESGGELLDGVTDRDIYRGSLTTLMRLVFLLYAEQRQLLPITDPTYADGYAVTTLYAQLTEARDRYGEEVGDRRSAAWPRLLATFSAVHGGCEHPDLRIPAHGGSLFDPAKHPWLARAGVTDRVVHEVLDALLMLRHKGKAAERLSYDGLSVEQIGHVYEGLLEFSCLRVAEPHLGFIGKQEPELPLVEVEARGDSADWLRETCGLTAKQMEKALAARPNAKQRADLHAACDNDAELAERALPFWGLLRTDLRGLPTVFPANSVLFTQVGDRRATGTHYTPRSLAQEVVEHTLAPLCFVRESEGVHRLRTADELLALKVCDPTMGSGAFLVAACEYLAERLVEAWQRDGQPSEVVGTAEDVRLEALRRVAAKCIYGVDRDDMAVDLAKLSMWLLTLAKNKPFGFLDHALRCGDSLIGVRTAEQMEAYCLDPEIGRQKVVERFSGSMDKAISAALMEATELRKKIEDHPADTKEDIETKTALLARSEKVTQNAQLVADGVVAAALSTAGENESRCIDRLVGTVEYAVEVVKGEAEPSVELTFRSMLEDWLTGARKQAIKPFHWPLEFPEVMATGGGFDAVVGNPPFIGGTMISGRIGRDVLHYLQRFVNRGARGGGRADLCSYFLLRDLDIICGGRVGILATNTIAQNDTREVGLDQAVEYGWDIYRAVKSQPWPGSASLEVSLIWLGNTEEGETFYLDGNEVKGITPALAPKSRVSGNPYRLDVNAGQAFIGSYVLAIDSFALDPRVARELIDRDRRNRDVLFPLVNGVDLNSRPDCSAARWVVNFHDWPWDRVIRYPEVLRIIEEKAKPVLAQKDPKTYAGLMDRWWQYWRIRAEMLRAIAGLERVLLITRHARTGLPVWVSTGQVFTDATIVFATDRDAMLTLLSSNLHFAWWTTKGESTMRTDPRYTPSDGFETFAQPEVLTERMDRVGVELHEFRRSVMLGRELGLTKLYNRVHDDSIDEPDIVRLREIHTEVDEAVAEAYGWTDLDLRHDFYDTRQGRRFTIDPVVQVEILDRLLELNFEHYEEEVKAGRHATKRKSAKAAAQPTAEEGMLF